MPDAVEAGATAYDAAVSNEGEPGDLLAEAQENVDRAQLKVEKEQAALASAEEALTSARAVLAELEGA